MISVGVTGSSGKTSTKDLIAQILETVAPTVSPVGSQNNEVGVPLTACRVDDETTYLVSEMGARGIGHIAWLTSLVGLDVGVCLNVGRAHMGEFGGLEVTAKAKSEIVAELSPEGWAVLNADDPWVAGMRATTRAQVAWFGEGPLPEGELGVTARDISLNRLSQASFDLVLTRPGAQARAARVALQVIGRHQVSNALAAAATALAVGLDLEQVASALSAAKPRSDWRMELIRLHSGALVLNDSYNANPDSMAAALTTVGALIDGARGEHPDARAIAVLGDMLELGLGAGDLHEELGRKAAENGVGEVIAVGQFAPQIVAGARSAGIAASIAQREEVVSSLTLVPGDVVLVKGSRGVGLEKVAAELVARDGDAL